MTITFQHCEVYARRDIGYVETRFTDRTSAWSAPHLYTPKDRSNATVLCYNCVEDYVFERMVLRTLLCEAMGAPVSYTNWKRAHPKEVVWPSLIAWEAQMVKDFQQYMNYAPDNDTPHLRRLARFAPLPELRKRALHICRGI